MSEKRKSIRKENNYQKKAFLRYCELRDENNDSIFEIIADENDVKINTVYNWSSWFNWKDRYEEEKIKMLEEIMENRRKNIIKQDIAILDIIGRFINDLKIEGIQISKDPVKQLETVLSVRDSILNKGQEATNIKDVRIVATDEEKEELDLLGSNIENIIEQNSGGIDENAITIEKDRVEINYEEIEEEDDDKNDEGIDDDENNEEDDEMNIEFLG